MTDAKLHLLANGAAYIADALDVNFWEVIDALVNQCVIEEDEEEAIRNFEF